MSALTAVEVLALHREIVGTPSVSGEEAALAGFLHGFLEAHGERPLRLGDSLLVLRGAGPAGSRRDPGAVPLLLLDSHLDTVPPALGWSRDPFVPVRADGRVYGLGSNDAKASVAAMIAAFLATAGDELPFTLGLALVEGEETRGVGTTRVLAHLAELGHGQPVPSPGAPPSATPPGRPLLGAVFGEPTGLDVATAQKGLLVLELVARGQACHAAHAAALGAENAALVLAADLLALAGTELAPAHPRLGATTLQPTVVRAGTARNVVPGEATAVLDVRTTPAASHDQLVASVRGRVRSEVKVISDRLRARETAEGALLVRAAALARPGARLYGSPTLSDLVYVAGSPAIKCGPGDSERSHTPDEWVGEDEVIAGAAFYGELIRSCARLVREEGWPAGLDIGPALASAACAADGDRPIAGGGEATP